MKTERTAWHCREIKTPADFVRTLNAGPYAWPGGYPLYFVASDGEALSFAAAKKEAKQICAAIREKSRCGWQVIGCEVNWENADLTCAHSGERIPSAYAEPENEKEPGRILAASEVVCSGHWFKWSDKVRDNWEAVPSGSPFIGLPVETLRVRHGQPSLRFAEPETKAEGSA